MFRVHLVETFVTYINYYVFVRITMYVHRTIQILVY